MSVAWTGAPFGGEASTVWRSAKQYGHVFLGAVLRFFECVVLPRVLATQPWSPWLDVHVPAYIWPMEQPTCTAAARLCHKRTPVFEAEGALQWLSTADE